YIHDKAFTHSYEEFCYSMLGMIRRFVNTTSKHYPHACLRLPPTRQPRAALCYPLATFATLPGPLSTEPGTQTKWAHNALCSLSYIQPTRLNRKGTQCPSWYRKIVR